MNAADSIFLDFALPNATTWFYLSLLLAVTLFFKFSRPFSLRNWDLLMLFLLVPALLFLRQSQEEAKKRTELGPNIESVRMLGQLSAIASTPAPGAAVELAGAALNVPRLAHVQAQRNVRYAYLWLLLGSTYFLGRCLIDLALERRTAFVPNLSATGLGWLGLTLLLVLSVKLALPFGDPAPETGKKSIVLEKATEAAAQVADRVNQNVAQRRGVTVSPGWDADNWVRGVTAIACHVLVVGGLICIGGWHFQSVAAGIGAAVLYLLLPYTAYFVKDIQHTLPAAFLTVAVLVYRYPTAAGIFLALATAAVQFPLLLFMLPLWIGFYWQRGVGRFLFTYLAVLASVLVYLWIDGDLRSMIMLPDPNWQAWNFAAMPNAEGLWSHLETAHGYRVPIFIAYLVLVIGSFWAKNLAHLIALSAALILGIQLWYADHGGTYVLWYLPLLILLVMRPNLSERKPALIDPEKDWLCRTRRWTRRILRGKAPQPALAPPARVPVNQ